MHSAKQPRVLPGRCARHRRVPGWGLTPVSRPHIPRPGDRFHPNSRNLQIAGLLARAYSMRVSHREARSAALKEHLVEVVTLERTLTELDHVRLLNLLRRDARGDGPPAQARAIEDLLDASALVSSREVAPDVVTMYSQVMLQDMQTSQRNTLTLCYPADAEPAMGSVSVLSPVGSALLGLRVGSVARWITPSGDEKAAEILAILFQPESSGDYAM